MLAPHEAQMLRWIAANAYTGRGDIADLGCFLGGSTCAFGDGLRASGCAFDRRPIQTYDMLVTPNDPFDSYANGLIGDDKKPGESFLDRFEEYTAPYADLIDAHPGDVRDHKPTRPIEVLFVDIAKGADINDHLVRSVPGVDVAARAAARRAGAARADLPRALQVNRQDALAFGFQSRLARFLRFTSFGILLRRPGARLLQRALCAHAVTC